MGDRIWILELSDGDDLVETGASWYRTSALARRICERANYGIAREAYARYEEWARRDELAEKERMEIRAKQNAAVVAAGLPALFSGPATPRAKALSFEQWYRESRKNLDVWSVVELEEHEE